jgi:hypothetical protein
MARKFASPRAARRWASSHAVEAYAEQINDVIEKGNRIISVPRGVAHAIATALSIGTADEPGWRVQLRKDPGDDNKIQLVLVDVEEDAALDAFAATSAAAATAAGNGAPALGGMTPEQIAQLGLRGPDEPPPEEPEVIVPGPGPTN